VAPDKAHALAILLTLVPVAVAAFVTRSRAVFLLGGVGAVLGVAFLAPIATIDFFGDVTEFDRLWAYTQFDLEGSLPAAAIGVLIWWIATPREPRTRSSSLTASEVSATERPSNVKFNRSPQAR